MSTTVTFQNTMRFVLLILNIPGVSQPVHNTYPDCYAIWEGEHVDVYKYGEFTNPRASYLRSQVILMENHGDRGKDGEPSSTGQQTALLPAVQNTQSSPVRTFGAPPVPPMEEQTHEYSSGSLTPVPKPSVAELQAQHAQNLAAVHAPTTAEVDRIIDKNLAKLHNPSVEQTIERARKNYADRQSSFGRIERSNPPGSQMALISDTPKDSAWSAMKQIVRKSDEARDFPVFQSLHLKSRSGIGRHRWSGGAHRKALWLKRAVQWSKREFTRRTAYGLLAFRVYATPVITELSR